MRIKDYLPARMGSKTEHCLLNSEAFSRLRPRWKGEWGRSSHHNLRSPQKLCQSILFSVRAEAIRIPIQISSRPCSLRGKNEVKERVTWEKKLTNSLILRLCMCESPQQDSNHLSISGYPKSPLNTIFVCSLWLPCPIETIQPLFMFYACDGA